MANSYLNRTTGSPSNADKVTISAWIKRTPGAEQVIIGEYGSSSNRSKLQFKSNDKLEYYQVDGGSATVQIRTNRVFRDASAFYHIVMQYDSAQSTASDRLKLYINGTQETSLAISTYPPQNQDTRLNKSGVNLHIGQDGNSGNYFEGYISHIALVDNAISAPTVFGETDSTSGIWKFKQPTGITWGTNGFHLKFENSGNLGLDSSGQTNNFATNGNLKQALDTPSNVYATLNPLAIPTSGGANTFSNGNLTITNSADAFRTTFGTLGVNSGKWYWEAKFLSGEMKQMIGISKPQETMDFVGQSSGSWAWQNENQRRYNNNSYTSYGSTASSGDIIMVAFDATNGAIWVGKNGTWFNSATQSEIEAGTVTNAMYSSITMDDYFLPAFTVEDSNIQVNFGNGYFGTTAVSSAQNPDDGIGIFEYDVPAGYRALCTKSINAEEYS